MIGVCRVCRKYAKMSAQKPIGLIVLYKITFALMVGFFIKQSFKRMDYLSLEMICHFASLQYKLVNQKEHL